MADTVEAEDSEAGAEAFIASPLSRLTPFIEQMGAWPTPEGHTKTKDFSFEREWRHLGDFVFGLSEVAAIITPPDDQTALRSEVADAVEVLLSNEAEWRPLEASEVVGGDE